MGKIFKSLALLSFLSAFAAWAQPPRKSSQSSIPTSPLVMPVVVEQSSQPGTSLPFKQALGVIFYNGSSATLTPQSLVYHYAVRSTFEVGGELGVDFTNSASAAATLLVTPSIGATWLVPVSDFFEL